MKKSALIAILTLFTSLHLNAGTLVNAADKNQFVATECEGTHCDKLSILAQGLHASANYEVSIINDENTKKQIKEASCNGKVKDAALQAGAYLIMAGPTMAQWVNVMDNNSPTAVRYAKNACAFTAGVAFNIIMSPYFIGRGLVDINRAIQDNKEVANAYNVLFSSDNDETITISPRTFEIILDQIVGMQRD